MKKRLIYSLLITLFCIVSCKNSYDPPAVTTNLNLLVVDGFLNNSSDTTVIRLSRTRKLRSGTAQSGETNSQVTIEDDGGAVLYYFQEQNDGNYIVPGMNLDLNRKYRLRINTSNGKQYISDDIEIKQTPPIDSISWMRKENGVMISVNTHDPLGKTSYYRWDFVETWLYHSNYYSSYKFEDNTVKLREPAEFIFDCWKTRNSTDLLLGSSARLAEDVIRNQPVQFLTVNSIQVSDKYSILVRQYALTKKGYDYFQNLKKITEGLGSIFDAQPSQITGNIHAVNDPAETVLGFVTASTLQEKRIYINHGDVIPWNYHIFCPELKVAPLDSLSYYFANKLLVPVSEARSPGSGQLIGYNGAPEDCVDCRLNGGTTQKPDYWP